jgi:RecB family exonuclease
VALATVGVSALETLGRCPLQFFFRHVLRVRELDDEIDPFDLDAREMGLRVHKVLEAVYRALGAEDQLEPLFRGEMHARARALLDREWPAATRDLEARLGARVPVLWRLRSEEWRGSVERFLAEDLERLVARTAKLRSLEEDRREVLKVGPRVEIEVRARFDRVFTTSEGLLVGDYKTGRIERIDDVSEMLRGRRLQVPLYRMMAGADALVEILGVGPKHEPEEDEEPARPFRVFTGFTRPEQEAGFRETLRVLIATARGGLFPLEPDGHCVICDYRSACRRTHPPTLVREAAAEDTRTYHQVLEKDDKHPLLESPALERKLR